MCISNGPANLLSLVCLTYISINRYICIYIIYKSYINDIYVRANIHTHIYETWYLVTQAGLDITST